MKSHRLRGRPLTHPRFPSLWQRLLFRSQKNPQRTIDALSPTQMIVFSFLVIIGLGTLLLILPMATKGESLSVVEALFTAVSATCVTGLTVIDVGSELTLYGQCVVLCLIQAGGLGIMTFSTFFVYLLGGRASIREREIVGTTLSHSPVPNIRGLLLKIMTMTFIVEGIGVLLLTMKWLSIYPAKKAVFHGLFHSVSAFCNAGFSLYSDSFMRFRADIYVNLILMILIVAGGLGFVVLFDLKHVFRRHAVNVARISFHSKVVLSMTLFLIMLGIFSLYCTESGHAFKGIPLHEGLLASAFQSITARTAGFNTLHIGSLANSSCFVLMMLMFIGAAPGSCGGGVKVSTLGILFALLLKRFRRLEAPTLFNRTIPGETVGKALAIVISGLVVIAIVLLGLTITEGWNASPVESRGEFFKLAFETISAFGTVGLSMDVTPGLSSGGRILVIILMFVGRLGPLTLAVALTGRRPRGRYRYAKGEIMVG